MTRAMSSKAVALTIAGAGCAFSLLAALILNAHIEAYFTFISTLKTSLPALVFLFGSLISVLAAFIFDSVCLAQAKNRALISANHRLSSEIEQREAIETDKEQLKQALLQGQKLQAVGTLAGGIAHDFNNILYAIAGYTQMAHEDTLNRLC